VRCLATRRCSGSWPVRTLAGCRKPLRSTGRCFGGRGRDRLCFDDFDGWRFHAIIANVYAYLRSGAEVERHQRWRGGGGEEAIRQLKGGFGLCHAPVQNFCGNWLWWHVAALGELRALPTFA